MKYEGRSRTFLQYASGKRVIHSNKRSSYSHAWLYLRHPGRILSAGNFVAKFEVFTTAGAMYSGTWRRDLWYKSAVFEETSYHSVDQSSTFLRNVAKFRPNMGSTSQNTIIFKHHQPKALIKGSLFAGVCLWRAHACVYVCIRNKGFQVEYLRAEAIFTTFPCNFTLGKCDYRHGGGVTGTVDVLPL
jgi:hypothetical protein